MLLLAVSNPNIQQDYSLFPKSIFGNNTPHPFSQFGKQFGRRIVGEHIK